MFVLFSILTLMHSMAIHAMDSTTGLTTFLAVMKIKQELVALADQITHDDSSFSYAQAAADEIHPIWSTTDGKVGLRVYYHVPTAIVTPWGRLDVLREVKGSLEAKKQFLAAVCDKFRLTVNTGYTCHETDYEILLKQVDQIELPAESLTFTQPVEQLAQWNRIKNVWRAKTKASDNPLDFLPLARL